MPNDPPPDISKACWRCRYWGGLVAQVHASCTREEGCLQASPMTGCVHWRPGAGDTRPAEWLPEGFTIRPRVMIWGREGHADEKRPIPPRDERPTNPSDAFKFDQQQDAKAWRAADALMERARQR